jgi:hypothetical protein
MEHCGPHRRRVLGAVFNWVVFGNHFRIDHVFSIWQPSRRGTNSQSPADRFVSRSPSLVAHARSLVLGDRCLPCIGSEALSGWSRSRNSCLFYWGFYVYYCHRHRENLSFLRTGNVLTSVVSIRRLFNGGALVVGSSDLSRLALKKIGGSLQPLRTHDPRQATRREPVLIPESGR